MKTFKFKFLSPAYRRLLSYLKPYRHLFIGGVMALLLIAGLESSFPKLIELFLKVLEEKQPNYWFPLWIIGAFLLKGIATFTMQFIFSWIGNKVTADIAQLMFQKLHYLPHNYFQNTPSSHLLNRFSVELSVVKDATTQIFMVCIRDSVVLLGLMIYLLWHDWQLTLITFTVLPFFAIIVRLLSKRTRKIIQEQISLQRNQIQVIQESIQCESIIKVYGTKNLEFQRFYDINEQLRHNARRFTTAFALTNPVTHFLISVAMAVVMWFSMWQMQHHQANAAHFMGFLTASLMLLAPMKRLADVNQNLQRATISAQHIFEFLDLETPVNNLTNNIANANVIDKKNDNENDKVNNTIKENTNIYENLNANIHQISVNHLSFAYIKEKQVLHNLNVSILIGKTTALVGSSGSGKSTLLKLLMGLEQATEGQVFINNKPLETNHLDDLQNYWQHLGIVTQQALLFDRSLQENICYGLEFDQKWFLQVIEDCGLQEVLHQWNDKSIGENGCHLSGGQKQRVSIARAMYRKPEILFLDEATSALDNQSEQQVQFALEKLMKNRTCIMIAHRFSTLANADHIIVLEHGEIVEQGTIDELRHQKGRFYQLEQVGEI
jgi:subfamily B ATP-binding cassette protein MsbA